MNIKFSQYDHLMLLGEMKTSPFQRNKHPKEQIERLAQIMKAHGVRHPIHISNRTQTICFGHGRREAALLNGWSEYPVIYQDFESEDEEYSCVQSDNAIASWAELDLAAINFDLGSLGPDFDIDLLGISNFSVVPEFEPGIEEDQGKLDEKKPVITQCPNCGECFDANENKPKG